MDDTVTYIALLRGINVGGHRPLKMEDLRDMFGEMGFANVSTYIQSGNVIFDATEQGKDKLANKIKEQIENAFGYDVPTIVCSATYLENVLEQFPFAEKKGWRGYITFLTNQPPKKLQEELEGYSSDIERFSVGNRAVYVHIYKQAEEKPLFSSNFIQKRLGIPATNRNLRTVRKILELATLSE